MAQEGGRHGVGHREHVSLGDPAGACEAKQRNLIVSFGLPPRANSILGAGESSSFEIRRDDASFCEPSFSALTPSPRLSHHSGIIGLPYAVAEAGFVTGLILLVVLCLVTDWTIRLIVLNAKLSGRNSYIEVGRVTESVSVRR